MAWYYAAARARKTESKTGGTEVGGAARLRGVAEAQGVPLLAPLFDTVGELEGMEEALREGAAEPGDLVVHLVRLAVGGDVSRRCSGGRPVVRLSSVRACMPPTLRVELGLGLVRCNRAVLLWDRCK